MPRDLKIFVAEEAAQMVPYIERMKQGLSEFYEDAIWDGPDNLSLMDRCMYLAEVEFGIDKLDRATADNVYDENFDDIADRAYTLLDEIKHRANLDLLGKPQGEPTRRATEVLQQCQELQLAKGKAYNNVQQAEYYPNGLPDIYYMMYTKMTRLKSLLKNSDDNTFEGMDDTCRDLINYTSFFIEFMEGKMDGQ